MSARRDKLLSLFYPRRSTTLPFLLDRVLELHSHRYRTRGSFVRLAINTFLSHMLAPWKLGNLFLFARKGNRMSASRRIPSLRIAVVISLSRPFETSDVPWI